jgi:16S rRNA (cytosine967-C5)-methyltransferase
VKPGGSLVYAVCSMEPQEGEERIDAFLAEQPYFQLEPAPVLVDGVTPHSRGWLRVLPGMLEPKGGLDGFFTAHLVRIP